MSGGEDKVIVIAGASCGIGRATALLLAECGAKVVLGGRLMALAARVAEAGGEAVGTRDK
jgi:NADP-dependent 3-hydroxy acid dehydrogenase YdfG